MGKLLRIRVSLSSRSDRRIQKHIYFFVRKLTWDTVIAWINNQTIQCTPIKSINCFRLISTTLVIKKSSSTKKKVIKVLCKLRGEEVEDSSHKLNVAYVRGLVIPSNCAGKGLQKRVRILVLCIRKMIMMMKSCLWCFPNKRTCPVIYGTWIADVAITLQEIMIYPWPLMIPSINMWEPVMIRSWMSKEMVMFR